MRILLVGGGGREHALGWAMARHGHELFFTHDNPGFVSLGTVHLGEPVAVATAVGADLVVIGPEAPLSEGLADRLAAHNIPVFGPSAAAAKLETSKVYTRRFAQRHGLPGAAFTVVEPGQDFEPAQPAVIKLDGLAAGKGVWVGQTVEETREALALARALRPNAPILVEEKLHGPEVSVLGLSDGARVVPLPAARDHKRRFDGDQGPNTGGMGAVAPVAVADYAACVAVLERAVAGMAAEGTPFRGVLYGGFMLTARGPMLLEFNVRFGDPECQVLMPLFGEDPVPWLYGAAIGRLPERPLTLAPTSACCVVVSGADYPERSADADILALPAEAPDLLVFHAGTRNVGGKLRAVGGRVLGITGLGPTPAAARARAYAAAAEVRFDGAAFRTDIGATWTT